MEISHFKLKPTLEKRRYRFLLFLLFYIIQYFVFIHGYTLFNYTKWEWMGFSVFQYNLMPFTVPLYFVFDYLLLKIAFMQAHKVVAIISAYLLSLAVMGLVWGIMMVYYDMVLYG